MSPARSPARPRLTRARLAALVLLLSVVLPIARGHAVPAPRPGVRGVLLVSVDGLRPDLIARAHTPVLHGLMERGAYDLRALTTAMAVTLPSHVSMLTGVPPEVHGVTWNGDPPSGVRPYPSRPTLFELAHAAGYRTEMVAGKSKFVALDVPGTLDRSFAPEQSGIGDNAVTDTALSRIDEGIPGVLFVHLPGVDGAGHTYGWGSRQQIAAIEKADRNIGRLLDALRSHGVLDSTVVLVTADHGGSGRSHGARVPRSDRIPWILAGPGVRPGVDLAAQADLVVRTEDTFATLCHVLGIAVPADVAGRVVDAAFLGEPVSEAGGARGR